MEHRDGAVGGDVETEEQLLEIEAAHSASRRLSPSAVSLGCGEERARPCSESFRDAAERLDGRITQAPLDPAQVRPVDVGLEARRLLREARLLPSRDDGHPESLKERIGTQAPGGDHGPRFGRCGLSVYGL